LKNNWLIFANYDILSNKLAKKILIIAEESIKLKSDFTVALAGQKIPKKLYEILKGSNSEWGKCL
jgi:6-phosphogluconolactonase/glucosamine-6-phosphate isomerase/deaminase